MRSVRVGGGSEPSSESKGRCKMREEHCCECLLSPGADSDGFPFPILEFKR